MQEFDPDRYPNLVAMDEKVAKMLKANADRDWDVDRKEYEICKIHPVYWMEHYGWIRPGEVEVDGQGGGAEPIPLVLNPEQLQIADQICGYLKGDKFQRILLTVLKHRKAGISTLIAAFDYWFMRFHGLYAFAIADLGSHTDNIVEMIQLFFERDMCGKGCENPKHRPLVRKPMPKNKKGIKLSNGVILEQDTGENSNPGTSGTINVVHMSENSKWRDPDNAETSLLNSVPRKGFAFVIKESTAYGINKFAHDCKQASLGKSIWDFCFITWLDMPDCEDPVFPSEQLDLTAAEKELMASYPKMRLGHVKFRRRQIETMGSEQLFKQDFPLNPREPFLVSGANYFNVAEVEKRIDTLNFFKDWKELGIEAISGKYPDVLVRIKSHPRGMREALGVISDTCCTGRMVELSEGLDGAASYMPNPEAKMENGAAMMFKPPRRGGRYVVSIDVAEGKRTNEYTSDNSIIEVFDGRTREQCLEWGGVFDEEMTADMAVIIAKIYNNAVIVPEINNTCGGTLLTLLLKSKYPNLYKRDIIHGNTRKQDWGWDTKSGLKREVISKLKLDFKNGHCLLYSEKLLEEMLYYMDTNGKLGAAEGHTDDRVQATAVALMIISITPSLRGDVTAQLSLPDSVIGGSFGTSESIDTRRYL